MTFIDNFDNSEKFLDLVATFKKGAYAYGLLELIVKKFPEILILF